jgi:hypothetical protein
LQARGKKETDSDDGWFEEVYRANIKGGGQRRLKEDLIAEIDKLDKKAEEVNLEVADWEKRNNLEAELVELYRQEELY